MKLYVPSLGDKLVLTRPWTFPLYAEQRNLALYGALGVAWPTTDEGYYDASLSTPVTLPAGVELTVRRIYIRQGQAYYDSITFSCALEPWDGPPTGKRPKPANVRFWAKLRDCDGIVFEVQP